MCFFLMERKALLGVVDRQGLSENVKNIVRTSWLLAFISLHRHNQPFYEMVNPGSFLMALLKKYNL